MRDAPHAAGERQENRRWWFIVLIVGLVLFIPLTALLIGIAVPVYRNNVIAANETSALQAIRTIAVAQESFLSVNGRYGAFDELISAGTLDSRFAGDAPTAHGYVFTMKLTHAAADGQPPVFSINADPQPGEYLSPTGVRHFFFASNVSGIRVNEEFPATATDRPRT